MRLRSSLAVPALLSALALVPAAAQTVVTADDVDLVISGTVQPRASYGYQEGTAEGADFERAGFGLRRARFQTRATWQDRLGFEFDFDGSSGRLTSVDLYGFFRIGENWEVRAGRQPGAQPRSYIPTSHSKIDIIERASIAERWAQGTIGSSGRDIGLDVEYAAGGTEVVLFVHNGTGSFDRGDGNFRESITGSSVTRGREQLEVAVTAMAQHEFAGLPGVEIGAFAGYNPVGGDNTVLEYDVLFRPDTVATTVTAERGYTTGGVHAYWGADPGSQSVRLKLDALAIRYEEIDRMQMIQEDLEMLETFRFQQDAVGVSGFGAVRVLGHGEVFARYERFWQDTDQDSEAFVSAGGSYSLSAARGGAYKTVRLTLAYTHRDAPRGDDAHLVVLQGQFAF